MLLKTVLMMAVLAPPPKYVERDHTDMVLVVINQSKKMDMGQAETMLTAMIDSGKRWNIDPLFLLALSYSESRWTKTAVGDNGRSTGLYQITLSVARTVSFGGYFEDKPSEQKVLRSRKKQKKLLMDVWVASQTAAAYLARLRDRYGKGADVVYNCGPLRCGKGRKRMKSTPVTRSYWRNYRKFTAALKKVKDFQPCN
tara:strand:+ start:3456 stop:4049 length:594 start_codon:yes stop_codon:yes gene_type:complete